MKLSKSKYEKLDAVTKIIGLVLLAVSVDRVTKGNYSVALALFGLGALISIIPLCIDVEPSA